MDATDLPGWYELGIPNAALATGADSVIVNLKGATNMAPVVLEIQLTDPVISPVHLDWGLLKQSTNVHRLIGPLINKETGAPITSVTLGDITAARVIQTTTVTRSALTLAASGTNQFTHVGDGYWELDLSTTDTGTLGHLAITLRDDDLFHPVQARAMVVPANIYDSLVGGSDTIDVSVTQWLGTAVNAATAGVPNVNMTEIAGDSTDATDFGTSIDNTNNLVKSNITAISDDLTAATNCEAFFDGTGYAGGATGLIVDVGAIKTSNNAATILGNLMLASSPSGLAQFSVDTSGFAPTTTQFEVGSADATDDHYNGGYVVFITGNLFGARYEITDYDGANNRFTVATMAEAPANGDTFQIV
jgi:hypothetical protein